MHVLGQRFPVRARTAHTKSWQGGSHYIYDPPIQISQHKMGSSGGYELRCDTKDCRPDESLGRNGIYYVVINIRHSCRELHTALDTALRVREVV